MHDCSTLHIGDLAIQPPLALAPMVGLSHSALRSLVIELGGVGLLYTEMLSAKRLPQENEHFSPCLVRSSQEQPLFYQIFLTDAELVGPAVEKLHRVGADGVDLNLGCPAPQMRRRGAGSVLAGNHRAVKKILAQLRTSTDLPISVKIRLGERDKVKKFLDLCQLIEDEGGDVLVIHARFDREKFCRRPRWAWIEQAKRKVCIPVIANGGIFTVEDARNCLDSTGADGLMIGRGAVSRPWMFAEIAHKIFGISSDLESTTLAEIYFQFSRLLTARFAQERRLGRIKKFTHYFASSFMFGHQLAYGVQTSATFAQAMERAEAFFENNEQLSIEGGRYV